MIRHYLPPGSTSDHTCDLIAASRRGNRLAQLRLGDEIARQSSIIVSRLPKKFARNLNPLSRCELDRQAMGQTT
jgi:hypothetical protein